MKTFYILAAAILLFSSSCKEHSTEVSTNDVMNTKSADGNTNADLPEIKFEEETHDFGRITQGEKVTLKQILSYQLALIQANYQRHTKNKSITNQINTKQT